MPTYIESKSHFIAELPNSMVCESLGDALIFVEDVLIALEDPTVLQADTNERSPLIRSSSDNVDEVKSILETFFPEASSDDIDTLHGLMAP